MAYTREQLRSAYAAVGVSPGRVVYVTSDLGRLMAYEQPGKEAVLSAHFQVLMELLGPEGTLVVPTASVNLCNTPIPFDLDATPSHQVGALSEYVRTRPGTRRSFHPFVSYGAHGRLAEAITGRCARHAFGPETPEARLVELDALVVSVGVEPNLSCSTVHHVEQVMAVPYRYAKEYPHPVVRDGKTVEELFYQYVWYRGIGVRRDRVRKIWARFSAEARITHVPLGRGALWSYGLGEFYRCATRLFAEDIYIWCEEPPTDRPYRV